MKPLEIERHSFEAIERECPCAVEPSLRPYVYRVIHATADFDFARTLAFSREAVSSLTGALLGGCQIISDTTMIQAGLNKRALGQLGCRAHCFIADEDVAEEARHRGLTRSYVAMEKAAELQGALVFAIGNAPTALFALCDLMEHGRLHPALVIGVPVGFVNVVEAKERLMRVAPQYIVAKGRKGGSTVAAALVNAGIYQVVSRSEA